MLVSDSGLVTQPMVRASRRCFGFQRFMAIWERTAPYNAVTLLEINPDIPVHEIEARWNAISRQLGYAAGPMSVIDCCSEEESASAWITYELCRVFQPDDIPFRLTVLRSPGRLWIRLGYRHINTDGWTIAMIVKRLLGTECPGAPTGRYAAAGKKQSLFRSLIQTCGECLKAGYPERGSTDDRQFMTDSTVPFSLRAVQSQAGLHQVTLNDLILGAVADAISEVKPNWIGKQRSRTLIQVPVNVRESTDRYVAGQFIGSWIVSVPPGTFTEKLRAVSQETAKHKSSGEAFKGQWMIDSVGAIAQWAPTHLANWLGRKLCPLAAIVSNLNYSQFFSSELNSGKVFSYTRTTSPGELAPLIVTVTSLGDTLDVRATAWTNCMSVSELRHFVEAIERRLDCRS